MNIWRITFLLVAFALLAGFLLGTKPVALSGAIIDVSWPNCQAPHAAQYRRGIVGATGGLDFRPNKCLVQEAGWFQSYDLYMNTGYPGDAYGRKFEHAPLGCASTDSTCLAYNYGYNAALYAINYADKQNIHAQMWWLDVETDNSWTTDPQRNIASLEGAAQAVEQRVFLARVGFYSYPGQWNLLTGGWHNGLPAWAATGQTTKQAAVLGCQGTSFTGGPLLLAQYTVVLDQNILCRQ